MRVNIYIRKEDEEAWENIADKPKWIHEGLTTGLVTIPPRSVSKKVPTPGSQEDVVKKVREALEPLDVVKNLFPQAKEICKVHGTPLTVEGRCLQKGCKYS